MFNDAGHVDTKPTSKAAREAKAKRSALAAANNAGASNSMGLDEDELERRATAIEIVAELQLTAEQLKVLLCHAPCRKSFHTCVHNIGWILYKRLTESLR